MTPEQEIADAPIKYRNLVARALNGSASPRQAIKARCYQCVGFIRSEIVNCSAQACALWKYRPFQNGDK